MNKVIFAGFAAIIAAVAMVAPTEAGSIKLRFDHGQNVIRIHDDWHAEVVAPACWTKKVLKHDYAGNLYLKKVRICA